jgi:hypothetical protein
MSATEQVNDSGEKNEIRSVEEKFEQCCNKVPSHNSGHRKLSARNKKRRGQVRAVRNGPNAVQSVRDDGQSISISIIGGACSPFCWHARCNGAVQWTLMDCRPIVSSSA